MGQILIIYRNSPKWLPLLCIVNEYFPFFWAVFYILWYVSLIASYVSGLSGRKLVGSKVCSIFSQRYNILAQAVKMFTFWNTPFRFYWLSGSLAHITETCLDWVLPFDNGGQNDYTHHLNTRRSFQKIYQSDCISRHIFIVQAEIRRRKISLKGPEAFTVITIPHITIQSCNPCKWNTWFTIIKSFWWLENCMAFGFLCT